MEPTRHERGESVYNNEPYPTLQAIYPDLQNRFPEEDGFDSRFEQPFLQPGARWGHTERDFWDSNDSKSSLFSWKFPDQLNTSVYLSEAVHTGVEAVTYVSHDEDGGDWQFHGDSMSAGKPPVVVCFRHPIDADPSLTELADLPIGWCAERAAPGEPWIRSRKDDN